MNELISKVILAKEQADELWRALHEIQCDLPYGVDSSCSRPKREPNCCFVCEWYVADKSGKFDRCSAKSDYNHISKDFCCSMFSLHPTLERRKKPIEPLARSDSYGPELTVIEAVMCDKLNELIERINENE